MITKNKLKDKQTNKRDTLSTNKKMAMKASNKPRLFFCMKSTMAFIFLQLAYLVANVAPFKLTIVQNETLTLDCGSGGGITIGGWIKPTSDTINYAVDEGTRTGDSLNLYKEASPSYTTSLTKKIGSHWVYTAMHWSSGCVAQGFYRVNNNDLDTIATGTTSFKFNTIFSLQNTVASSFNLVSGSSQISPALRNENFIYGPAYVLEHQTLTPPNQDNVALELAFGPSFMSSIDFLWKYDQFQDFEDQTAFKVRIFDGSKEKSYMEDGNFNSYGVLVKTLEVMRFVEYNSSVYDMRSYFRINVTDFPTSVPLTEPVSENVTDSDGDSKLVYYPLPDNLVYLSTYLFSPQTMHSRKSSYTRLISPADEDNPYISMHMIAKFWHGHETNTMNFNFSQTDDDRNSFTFNLVFDSSANTITFVPGGIFSTDGTYASYSSFTSADGYKEFILSMGLLNTTTNHSTTNANQGTVHFKLTLSDQKNLNSVTWYASVEKFYLIESKGFIFAVKNNAGSEVSFSELRFGDGALDYELLQASTTNDEQFYNLEDTTKMAVQCPDTSYLDLTTYQCAASCDSAFSSCYSQNEGTKCDSSQYLNLVGRKCSASCDTSAKFYIETTTTQTKECTQCLDRYCETCPLTTYNCETYKVGNLTEPKYFYFNQSDQTMTMRFERMVNFSRLGEYTNSSFSDADNPAEYTIISNNKTGNYDVVTYFNISKTINDTNLKVQFTRVVNWNYGDPDVFYTIENKTHYMYTGWYNNTGWTGFTNWTGRFIGTSAKVLAVGGALFDPTGFTKIIKLWSYTQFLFYLNIELPLGVKSFIYNFRWSLFRWLPNLFKDTAYWCYIYTFKFEQNSLDCSLWRNIAYNVDVWTLLLAYKLLVLAVSRGLYTRKNWYVVKFKMANQRLNAEFLWRLLDAQLLECVLYLFLYFDTFKLNNPGRADHVGGYILGAIYLFMIIWINVIIGLFLERLNPKKMTEEEAKKKAQVLLNKKEKDKDDENPDEKGDKKKDENKDALKDPELICKLNLFKTQI